LHELRGTIPLLRDSELNPGLPYYEAEYHPFKSKVLPGKGSGDHPATYLMGVRGSFPGGKAAGA